eukprot:symbB.v1.2.001093.t1/scaffold33.1/size517934/45
MAATPAPVTPNIITFSSMISKVIDWRQNLGLLSRLAIFTLEANVVTYTTLFSTNKRADNLSWLWCLHLLNGFPGADPLTYTSAIHVFNSASAWIHGLQSLETYEANPDDVQRLIAAAAAGSDHFIAWNPLCRCMTTPTEIPNGDVMTKHHGAWQISTFAKQQQWEQSIKVLAHLQRSRSANLITYGAAIHSCERGARWRSAMLLEKTLQLRSLESNVFTAGAAMSSCEKLALWMQSLEQFSSLQSKELQADVVIYGTTTAGSWQCSQGLLDDMELRAIETNHIVFGAALALGTPWQQAALVLHNMRFEANRPDIVTFNSTMPSMADECRWMEAIALLQDVKMKQIRQTTITFNTTVNTGERAGHWQEVLLLFQSAVAKALQSDAFSASSLLNAYTKTVQWQEALQVSQEFHDKSPDLVIFNGLISACGKSSQWQLALELLFEVLLMSFQPDIITYGAAISACEERNESH